MKKIYLILGFTFIALAAFIVIFVYKNLRGVGPAFNPPISDSSADKTSTNATGMPLSIPNGFSISIFAEGLKGPRVLAFDPTDKLLVSLPSVGTVVTLPEKKTVVSGLNLPHGIAFHDGKMYIAETDQVARYDYDAANQRATNKKKIVDLPGGGNHFSRTIGFGPDGKLYISIGSSCNVCIEKDARRAKILVANPDGSDLKEYASGLRNSVFFVWHPNQKTLWATDMGRDLIGDDIPPEEVNIVSEDKHYGWPYCYGKNVWDKTFDGSDNAREFCKTIEPPHIEYQAHAAPLGLAFIPKQWGKEYEGDLLVAFHGSWNRTAPVGYKIVWFRLDEKGNYLSSEDFISGWFPGGAKANAALGRPVDLLFDESGVFYISDDKAGVIYKVIRK